MRALESTGERMRAEVSAGQHRSVGLFICLNHFSLLAKREHTFGLSIHKRSQFSIILNIFLQLLRNQFKASILKVFINHLNACAIGPMASAERLMH